MANAVPTNSEFADNHDAAAYDAWFRAKVVRAMESGKPSIPHDQVMAMAQVIIDKHKPR